MGGGILIKSVGSNFLGSNKLTPPPLFFSRGGGDIFLGFGQWSAVFLIVDCLVKKCVPSTSLIPDTRIISDLVLK